MRLADRVRPLNAFGRDATIIVWARALRAAGMGILIVLVAPYLDLIGYSAPEIGLVFTLSLIGGVAMSLPATFAGDLVGRRRLFVVFSLITSVAGFGLALTEDLALLSVGSFFGAYAATGMNVGPLLQVEQAALSEASPPRRRTSAFAYLGIVSSAARGLGNVGAALPPLIVIVLGSSEPESFKITFGLYAALNLVATLMYAFLSPAVEATWADRPKAVNPLRTASSRRIVGISFLFGVDSMAGGMIADTFISLWLVKKFDLGVEVVGGVFVAAQVLNSVSLWVAAWLARRWGLLNTMVWTQAIANGFVLAFAFAPWAWLAIALWLCRAFWNEMDVPTRQSYSMAVVGSEERMAMAGAANMGRAGLRVPSPAITGGLWAASLNVSPFVIASIVKLAYNLALYRAFRDIVPPEEASERPGGAVSGPDA